MKTLLMTTALLLAPMAVHAECTVKDFAITEFTPSAASGLAGKLSLPEHWDRLALRRLLDDLSAAQRGIAAALLAESGADPLEKWIAAKAPALARTRAFLAALEESGELSIAKLMLSSSQIQNLA